MTMQRNEIIELARKNGATIEAGKQPGTIIYEGTGGITFEVLEQTVKAAVMAEREACAMACDRQACLQMDTGADDCCIAQANRCATDIRMRSNFKLTGWAPPTQEWEEWSNSQSEDGLANHLLDAANEIENLRACLLSVQESNARMQETLNKILALHNV